MIATLNETEIIDNFRVAMAEQGIQVSGEIVADGKFHRIHVDGDKKLTRNGFYVLHLDGKPAGAFGCNRRYGNEHKFTWTSKDTKPLTPEERRAFRECMERQRSEREAEARRVHAAAAQHANFMWDQAKECTEHPYLTRKGVKSHGLRVGNWEKIDQELGTVDVISNQALLIPIRDIKKTIHSLQAIFVGKVMGDRDKDFVKGGAKAGLFYSIGKPQTVDVGGQQRVVIMIGEGYATVASAHEDTGHAGIASFDAGNLLPVARALRKVFPDALFVFLADNDRFTLTPVENPGVHHARAASAEVGGIMAIPQFPADAPGKPTDFNDLHALLGADAVRATIEAALNREVTVVLAPDRQSATGAAYAMRAILPGEQLQGDGATFARSGPSDFVVQVYGGDDDLAQRAAELCVRYPIGHVYILARTGQEQAALDVAEKHGVRAETLAGFGDGKHETWFDAMMAKLDAIGESSPVARVAVDGAIGRAMKSQVAGAADDDGVPLMTARDEERRRQQQEENRCLQEVDAGAMIPSRLTLDEMLERCVFVAEKKFMAYVTGDRSMFLKADDFRVLTTAAKTEIEVMHKDKPVKKLVSTASLWLSDPRRVDAMTATFRAGAPIITVNPKGLRAVNTWRPTLRWSAKADISPFLEQVEYLFADPTERAVFLDWLAHIEQKPGELPHYGWLHVAENTGTGRNWMASVLARVFRGYTAPNVDLAALLDSQYNGELGGCVLGIVDEVQEGGSEGNYQHAQRLKSMVNAEMRTVNNKYGLKYLEFNALRWLVFSNHKNALPLNDSDRRFRVVMHKAPPRSPDVYERLYTLLNDPEFVNAVGVYLRERDIGSFKPGERPPLNADKIAAIAASKPMSTQGAEEIVAAWPADVIINKHVVELLTGTTEKKEFTPAMRRAMEEAGAQSWHQGKVHKVKVGSLSHRVWVLRNHAKWLMESTDAIRKEISSTGVDDLANRPAAVVLADAAEKMGDLREPAF